MDDLYSLPPEEFTAARDAAAKVDKAIKSLRRPTVSAWVVNTLVRREPDLLDQLLSLGGELAEAQRSGQGAVLRELGEQRRQLVQSVTDRAVELVDRDVSTPVRTEVESTLEAALADQASGEAVRTGRLVRPLSFAGFGGVDLEGAVADPIPGASPAGASPTAERAQTKAAASQPAGAKAADGKAGDRKAVEGKAVEGKAATKAKAGEQEKAERAARAVAEAEAAAHQAAGALDDAVRRAEVAAREVEQHQAAVAAAQAELDAATERVTQARNALLAAEKEQVEVRRRRTQIEKEGEALLRRARAATKAVATAQDAADAARVALDRLRRTR